jgi:uncharacterized protein YndB with AHSA1/START domain
VAKQQEPEAPDLDVAILIVAPPSRVLKAFFDPAALEAWWQVVRSVTIPRALGPYALEWRPTDFRDEVLGRLGGVFRGTVIQFQPGEGFFVADGFWLPPDGDPIGPMALEVTCTELGQNRSAATRVRITQTGCDDSARWRRYYEVIRYGWERALASLKALLEE